MLRTVPNGYSEESTLYSEQAFSETPFADPSLHESEEPQHESSFGELLTGNWEFTSPFLPGESTEAGASEATTLEASEFGEIVTELKDPLFRESLEQLADEALDTYSEQLEGEYGDRETRDWEAERLLTDHFQPLANEMEALLDRFFERLESYEAESLTDFEIGRIASEVMPSAVSRSPASEQFLGGLLRKAGKLVSGAVNLAKKGVSGAINLAGKGLAAIGKLALGPLLKPLKELGRYLLRHVVRFALNQLPPALRPLGKTLSDRLFRALGETGEQETEAYEQTESESLAASADAASLEAEFDVHAAQLLFTSDEQEQDHLVSSYGESEQSTAMAALDDARARLTQELARLQPGESAQPVMEQFIPAVLWPAAKTAITVLGRPKIVSFLGNLLAGLIRPLIGADPAKLLAPAIADAGLRIFGLETGSADARTLAAEALAATVEETVNSVGELPPHVLENETLLTDAVREAFENAAAAYFPNSAIKPEVRESMERHGTWARMPARGRRKTYAKYSDAIPVEIHPRAARSVETFGRSTLHDYLRDQHGLPEGQPYKGKLTVYQALPGTRGSTIARAEGFPASQLHPLTPQAAGVLLGPNAVLGCRPVHGKYLSTPQRLHVHQRLYRLEPSQGRRYSVRPLHSELLINLPRGELRVWLYLSEGLCQHIAADLAKTGSPVAAIRRIKPLIVRSAAALRLAVSHHHLPPEILVVGRRPHLNSRVPHWLRQTGHQLAAKISEWAQLQIAQYFRNNAEEFKRLVASHHDGVTLRITMTRVPGMELLRELSHGRIPTALPLAGWPGGSPAFQIVARSGFVMHRLRD